MKNGLMRLTNLRKNSPSRFGISIDRSFNSPVFLIKIGHRAHDLNWVACAELHLDLGQVEVAVVLTTWSMLWKRVVGHDLQPQAGDL